MHPFLRAIPYPVRPISARQGGFARRVVAGGANAARLQIEEVEGSVTDLAWVLNSTGSGV